MKFALSIDPTLDGILTVADDDDLGLGWDGFELPASVLSNRRWASWLGTLNRSALHLCNLLPDHLGRYLAETTPGAQQAMLESIRASLKRSVDFGARAATLDLGLPRVHPETCGDELAVRADLVRQLLPLAKELDTTICLPKRLPRPAPDIHFASYAARIVKDIDNPRCRLTLNIVPIEMRELTLTQLVERDFQLVGVIRFIYEPALGHHLRDDVQRLWAKALHWSRFAGTIVFCPRVSSQASLLRENERLQTLVDEIWRCESALS
jgi:hypothetical protein